VNPDAALDYLAFVPERHRVWEQRQAGAPQPWTHDPVLATRKFTNVFRVLDPGSQFVITDLCSGNEWETLFRVFLYRYTNLPAAWRDARALLGDYPTPDEHTLPEVVAAFAERRARGEKVFSGAYVILPQPNRPGDKIVQAVELAYRWLENHGTDFFAATSQQQRYDILRREYGVGPFLAMQILTDWGYTPQCGEDREAEFVVAGPGCIKGAKAIAPDWPVANTLEWATTMCRTLPDMPTVMGRKPSRMDVQNTLCEFSKYVRGPRAGTYVPAHPGPQPAPVLPLHWLDL
jgi:hypothetical protein